MGAEVEEILTVLAEIRRARHRELTLDEVGRVAAMSPGHVQRRFTAVVGQSPKQYQLSTRLAHAAALLTTTSLPVGDIAHRIGFGSHEAFSRAFRRRFGRSPLSHRHATTKRRPMLDPLHHQAQIDGIAPCVGLFRLPIARPDPSPTVDHIADHTTKLTTPPKPERDPMTYEITTEELAEVPIVSVTRRADVNAVADVLAEALPSVFEFVLGQGWAMAGPPLVRQLDQSPAFVTLQPAIALAEPPAGPIEHDEIEAGALPAGPALTTIHHGPYDTLVEAYAALDRWMADNALTPGGQPWEVYLTDPGEVPDPADWQTKVFWPLSDA